MENNLILGIDQSYTSTGCVILNPDFNIIHYQIISSNKEDDIFDRSIEISNEIIKIINDFNLTNIYIEQLAYGGFGNSTRDLAGLQFVIITNIKKLLNIKCELIPPTSLKKFATGKGNSKKDEMYNALPDYAKDHFKNIKKTKGLGDITDAYWLSRFGFGN